MHTTYLALGSNLGNRRQLMARAIELIGREVGTVERKSELYESEPWGFDSENRFLNAVVKVHTELEPMELLRTTQHIERLLGRKHKTAAPTGPAGNSNKPVYHDRTMDIDILLYDDLSIDEPTLKIPHPLMTERDFVMVPLREVMESKA